MTPPKLDRFIQPGNGSLPKVQLSTPEGDTAEIYLHGAHVTSWKTADGDEKLFLSPKSNFGDGAAIRGGVPICFPQFSGRGTLPKHGFARNMPWELVDFQGNSAIFCLHETEKTRTIWNFAFKATYTVLLAVNSLEMTLEIENTGQSGFSFTNALHTYFRVEDVRAATVKGLTGLEVEDAAHGDVRFRETQPEIRFPAEVDRVYFSAPPQIHLIEEKRSLAIETTGFPDATVWNPGPLKCAALADMEPDGYLRFVCIEAVSANPIRLAPGTNWRGSQTLVIGG